jgi:hypothetical protein
MMSDHCVTIRRLNNGFVIEATDPAIVKANNAPSKPGKPSPYRNARVEYAMKDFNAVLKWLKEHKDVLSTPAEDEYASAFGEACAED